MTSYFVQAFSKRADFSAAVFLMTMLCGVVILNTFYTILLVYSYSPIPLNAYSGALLVPYCMALLWFLVKYKSVTLCTILLGMGFAIEQLIDVFYGPSDTLFASMLWLYGIPILLAPARSIMLVLVGTLVSTLIFCSGLTVLNGYSDISTLGGLFSQNSMDFFTMLFIATNGCAIGLAFVFMLRAFSRSHQRGVHDQLTGLYNRHVLRDDVDFHFNKFRKTGQDFLLMYIDLDRFKEINDLFGHEIGDKVLRTVGSRLKALPLEYRDRTGAEANAYRVGGDEFIFLCSPAPDERQVARIVEDIKHSLKRPIDILDYTLDVDVSLGLAMTNEHATSGHDIVRFADIAMYSAKNPHGRGYEFSRAIQLDSWQRKSLIYKELESAQGYDRFYLDFQPIYSTSDLKLAGCEALLRWRSEKLGVVSPDEFIAIAESTGLIHKLTHWGLKSALTLGKEWVQQQPDFQISINVSPYHFREPEFISELKSDFSEYPNLQNNIVFEITESTSISNQPLIADALSKLAVFGGGIALDDFGQGSTSFLSLKNGHFTNIKIDKSLILEASQSEASAALVEAIVSSSHRLGLTVTAEGIETELQFNLARDLKCDYVQGFWLGKPQSPSEISKRLKSDSYMKKWSSPETKAQSNLSFCDRDEQ